MNDSQPDPRARTDHSEHLIGINGNRLGERRSDQVILDADGNLQCECEFSTQTATVQHRHVGNPRDLPRSRVDNARYAHANTYAPRACEVTYQPSNLLNHVHCCQFARRTNDLAHFVSYQDAYLRSTDIHTYHERSRRL